ncbi:growth factor receptor domain-containing protein [Armillaria novae-zelandiae]|uniref:Growth factor receptor domain-containing protein n=1 Tax=Armillaria novae-zelandiae TaxID=153914 RepID=A0AA39NZG9_9AGAR|nr:growth factor receptor domain-containing protein [Armillaria novae-zelandiae]
MIGLLIFSVLLFVASVVASSSSSSVVCVAGQCLQGSSNTTLGVTLSSSDESTSVLLLPGQYASTTNPQLLHNMLTSKSASLSPSPGFNSSESVALPLDLALEAGMAIYSGSLYSGTAAFTSLPSSPASNSSTTLSAASLAFSSTVWAAVDIGNERVVIWDSIPDVGQLPLSGSLSLLDLQSSACSTPCSSSGVCSASGTCTCPTGFTGESCESCASGFYGPECQACPSNCSKCDEGISGTGRCLVVEITNAPETCNCLNGECGSNGQCSCNAGWTTASNGTACAKCSEGFYLTSAGDCKVCELGCTSCADSTGTCLTCKTGFTLDANDKTKCDAVESKTSSGTVCPDGSFSSNGTTCAKCPSACSTCNGATSNDCILCATETYAFNGSCVSVNNQGVCDGSGLIADNNKHACDACGAKCTSCEISNFSAVSTVDELKCTTCLPGSFLSDGQCLDSCPTGTFVSPKDNATCTVCDSSCSTCSGSATFCLTCANSKLASGGSCVSSCPSGTFSSSGSCLTCHPDCATCSGSSFNQCSSCPSDRPVLANGRCLPTCSKSQYFDSTSSACESCDSSCSTCSGPDSSECLSCSSSSQYLRSGTCVDAKCMNSTSVISGLGVCLSELVLVQTVTTGSDSPVPSITGISDPTVTKSSSNKLAWWQILLMTLGCAFIFLLFVMCWRRRARKQRAKRTAMFATAKRLVHNPSWRWRLLRFGEKLFGHRRSERVPPETEEMKLMRAEEARHHDEIEKLIGSYASRHVPDDATVVSGPSIYSQVTGRPRQAPDVRQPVRKDQTARFSASTFNSSLGFRDGGLLPPPRSDAEAYAHAVRSPSRGGYWMEPNPTGSSHNPFRR